MKKLMFALATAAALVGMADIESANTVGYTTKTVEANKFYLIGVQFNETGTTAGKIDMNTLVKVSPEITAGTYDASFAGAPQIQVLSAGGGYSIYYYISDATDDDDEYLGYDCWADADGYQLKDADKLSLSSGFWFKSEKSGSVTVLGEVDSAVEKVVPFPANQFYIMSNPFPVAFSLADIVTTGIAPSTYDSSFADSAQIQVLSSSGGYSIYYYISDATDSDDEYVDYDCWSDADGYILEGNQVDAGASFWIKAPTAGSLGFKR